MKLVINFGFKIFWQYLLSVYCELTSKIVQSYLLKKAVENRVALVLRHRLEHSHRPSCSHQVGSIEAGTQSIARVHADANNRIAFQLISLSV